MPKVANSNTKLSVAVSQKTTTTLRSGACRNGLINQKYLVIDQRNEEFLQKSEAESVFILYAYIYPSKRRDRESSIVTSELR